MKSKTSTLAGLLLAFFFTSLSAQEFDVFVSDAANYDVEPWDIFRYDQDGSNGEKFISSNLGWPQDIVFLEHENTMLVSNLNDDNIIKCNADNGAFIGVFATGIDGATRMEIGPDSLLYVLQWEGNGKVKRFKLDGTFVDDFTETGVPRSIGLDWDTDGNLYVSSYSGNYVKKFSPTGADLGNFISSNLSGPTNVWFRDNGDLMVNGWNDGTVKRFNSNGEFQEIFISGIQQVEGVDFFPNGDIALGVGSQSTVKVYSPDGMFIKDLFPPGSAGIIRPNAVVFRFKETTATQEIYQEITFVTPTIGHQFQVSNPDVRQLATSFEVFNSAGTLVSKVNFADSTQWDASGLTDGIYHITAKLNDGTIARQKVVVKR
ncbi:MAG: T9SS type A sorting domain-containing protein [Bacteroidota bacterium]